MTQLLESMDKLQENMKLVAERIEKGTPTEGAPAYDPPQPPMGHPGMSQSSPPLAPMTPAPGVSLSSGHLPPPPAVPPRPVIPSPPTLPSGEVRRVTARQGWGNYQWAIPWLLEVKDIKSPPCQVIEEVTGRIRCVSPTARHDPLTGTAAFSPLGYMQIQGTREYRRVYPWCSYLSRVPKAPEFAWCNGQENSWFCQLEVHLLFSERTIWLSTGTKLEFKRGTRHADWRSRHNFVCMLFC